MVFIALASVHKPGGIITRIAFACGQSRVNGVRGKNHHHPPHAPRLSLIGVEAFVLWYD